MKFDFRYKLKLLMRSKLSLIPFAYSLKIGCSKKKTENYPGKCFWKEIKGDVKNQP